MCEPNIPCWPRASASNNLPELIVQVDIALIAEAPDNQMARNEQQAAQDLARIGGDLEEQDKACGSVQQQHLLSREAKLVIGDLLPPLVRVAVSSVQWQEKDPLQDAEDGVEGDDGGDDCLPQSDLQAPHGSPADLRQREGPPPERDGFFE
eukprot:UN4483